MQAAMASTISTAHHATVRLIEITKAAHDAGLYTNLITSAVGITPKVMERLSDAGLDSTIVRCPCTYPPGPMRGRMLSGMGVPDLRGGLGTSTFYTTAEDASPRESIELRTLVFHRS